MLCAVTARLKSLNSQYKTRSKNDYFIKIQISNQGSTANIVPKNHSDECECVKLNPLNIFKHEH